MRKRWHIPLMLAPALAVIVLLFGGGVLLALLQSLGYLPFLEQRSLSLAAYRHIFSMEAFWQSLLLTLWIALASTAVSTLLAIISALALRHTIQHPALRGQRIATFIFQLNIPIPHLVGAIGILFLFSQSGFLARIAYLVGLISEPAQFPALVYDRYALGIILEYVWKTTSFTGIIVLAALQSAGSAYEDVARNLGANRWQRFRHVILPLIRPGVLSASILVFAFTFGAFEVPLLLGQRYPSALPVLAYRSYTDVDLNGRPEAMAMSMIITFISIALIFTYMRLTAPRQKDS
ncbi:MAG: ABC transporter permease subunit [Ardenticatenaceae bacterium]|nr:ABC transporter permease subunit [Ardenticatenaceae bacterium]MCB8990999.1 ABC transporter permease subunit [Ardenticatenaceae bacterium]MCB9005321.1 ABC transporter permease subunit [Ardenticatenaceae bacterium]